MSISLVRRMFHHLYWADGRVLALLERSAEARGGQARRLFGHVLGAERVWLFRLRGESSTAHATWPELSVAEMRDLAGANRTGYERLLDGLGDRGLAAELAYSNQGGDPFCTPVGDVLTHVALHGAYHRGQIAAAVRAVGDVPVNTDYITFAREAMSPW